MNTRTDMELIQECLDTACDFSFEELVNRYKNLVYSIILRQTNNRDEAADLAQDIFLKIYKNLARYTPEFKFSTWVMRITSNHIIDQHRKKKMETVSYEVYTSEGGSVGTSVSSETIYLKHEQTERLQKIITGLPEQYRTPLILFHEHGLSYNEISEKINEPVSKIKNRIFRGRKMLKGLLVEGETT